MARSLCGELTCNGTTCDDDDDVSCLESHKHVVFVCKIFKELYLYVSTFKVFKEKTASISSLLCEAAADGDNDTITQLLQKVGNLTRPSPLLNVLIECREPKLTSPTMMAVQLCILPAAMATWTQ